MSEDNTGYNILEEMNKIEAEPQIINYEKNPEIKKDSLKVRRFKSSNNYGEKSKRPSSLTEIVTMTSDDLKEAHASLYDESGDIKDNKKILDDLNGNFRDEQIYNEAVIYGINSGLYSQAYIYKKIFEAPEIEKEMDDIFVFRSLLLQGGRVQPAIIMESKDVFIKENAKTTREIKQSYKIIEQAKVVSSPKDWRGYIMPVLNVEKPDLPHEILLPRTSSERKEWEDGVKVGWEKGIRMAQDNILIKLNELGNDLLGMIRYHSMLQQNIVSTPMTYEMPISVSSSSNGESLNIGETVFEINQLPKFNSSADTWKAIPQIENLIIGDKKW